MKVRSAAIALSAALVAPVVAHAQSPSTEPIRCWWRTSAGAVAIGQAFDATLTCAVHDEPDERTIPDESRLGAAALQLAPFEVLGGSHPADARTPTHRFFQYHYTIRIIDRDVIGHDAKFPDVQVSYRIHTRVKGETIAGRDRTYVIPGQPVRVLSLVPAEADDIRDAADADFARIEALRFRSRALRLIAWTLVVLGLAVLAPTAIALLRRRATGAVDEGHAPRRAVLAAAVKTLDEAERGSRDDGWTPDLAAAAVGALRVAAALAIGRGVSQRTLAAEDGTARLIVPHGRIRRRTMSVSSPVTANDVQRELDRLPAATAADRRQLLDDLRQALRVFTTALYRRDFAGAGDDLGDALRTAAAAVRRVERRG